jgi:Rps23 Pro-64 3,4-dihydroxylase Tpa1-like proline 4-hydroxylase
MTTPQPTCENETISIENLFRSERIKKSKDPYPHFYIDDFLPPQVFSEIETTIFNFHTENNLSTMHGGRSYINTTSYEFEDFLKKSSTWSEFFSKISSQESFDKLIEIFKDIDPKHIKKHLLSAEAKVKKYIRPEKHPFFSKISKVKNIKLEFCSLKAISAYLIRYVFHKIQMELRTRPYLLFNTIPVQLLADINLATDGYYREIHRDSDNRIISMLFFMSNHSESGEGGELGMYSLKNHTLGEPFPPQPLESECLSIQSIQPKKNRLVAFFNSDEAYHDVKEMKGHTSDRFFMGGWFTSYGKSMLRRDHILKTDYEHYI